jgi:hypothetical protein
MTSFRGLAGLVKMTSLWGKLTAMAKRVSKANELTYISADIGVGFWPYLKTLALVLNAFQ